MSNRLKLVDRIKARQAARQAWIASKQQGEDAILLVQQDSHIAKLDPATIALIIQIAIMLFKFWQSRQIDEPSVVIQADEPGFDEVNDAD